MKNNYSYEFSRDSNTQPNCWKFKNDFCLPHFHSSIEILYVTSGEIKATLNGQLYLVKSNNFLIVPSYYIHSYATELSSTGYVFTIPLDTIPSYHATLTKKTFTTLLIESSPYHAELQHCLDSICDIPNDMYTLAHDNIVIGYTYVFLGLLIQYVGLVDMPTTKITSLAQDILIYLKDNYLQYMNLEEIAEHFGYSKSRFSHIFNEYFGCSITEYINGLRCRHSLELLHKKSTTITEIALASGFDSTRTFYRAFQKCFGCTPNQYLIDN